MNLIFIQADLTKHPKLLSNFGNSTVIEYVIELSQEIDKTAKVFIDICECAENHRLIEYLKNNLPADMLHISRTKNEVARLSNIIQSIGSFNYLIRITGDQIFLDLQKTKRFFLMCVMRTPIRCAARTATELYLK